MIGAGAALGLVISSQDFRLKINIQCDKDCMDAATELTLDFAVLECISSAGLRLLLFARKTMNKMRTTFSMDFMMCRQCICR